MVEALATAVMGILVVFGGLYAVLHFIVLADQPKRRA